MRVVVWGEYLHEKTNDVVARIYPDGLHEAIAAGLRDRLGDGVTVSTATLEQPEHGLTDDRLRSTNVLLWWGHKAHAQVTDAVVERVHQRVLAGMGLVVLHSGHESKIFKRLMGTTCSLRWREADDREVVWSVNPGHPIARGLPRAFVIPKHEMYGEYFDIPKPDELIFINSFSGGEVFRGGCCFKRGLGRIFYFSPGHETYPVYYQPEVRRVIANAVIWARGDAINAVPLSSVESPEGWFEEAGSGSD
jgi:trehalose utilization protein